MIGTLTGRLQVVALETNRLALGSDSQLLCTPPAVPLAMIVSRNVDVRGGRGDVPADGREILATADDEVLGPIVSLTSSSSPLLSE